MNGVRNGKLFLAPPPGEESKGQISFNFNYKVNFKDSLYKTLCVYSQMKYTKHIRGDFILSPGSCPRGGTWGCLRAKINFRPTVCPLCYLLLNHWTKFNQIWCVSYSYEWGVQRHFCLAPWGPGEGSKII